MPAALDRPPFVGREAELAALTDRLEAAAKGAGGLVLVAGEPGIGKTRLLEELATLARGRGTRILWGRGYEDEGAPAYWPWLEILRAWLRGTDAAALRTELEPTAIQIAQLVPELRELLPDLPAPPDRPPGEARFRLFDAITTFFTRLASAQPLLLLLDDLHWADVSSLLLLEFLARDLADTRLLVVATYRDVDVRRGAPLARTLGDLVRRPHVARLLLGGWSAAEVAHVVAGAAGAPPPVALVAALTEETEGNPLFVTELVRLLAAQGRLGAMLTTELGRLGVPQTVRDVIGRRLDRLSALCSRALTMAAVLGREFDVKVLGQTAEIDADGLLDLLEEAEAAHIIAPAPAAPGRYRFTHVLIRETLYEDLPTIRRMRLHRQVGEALEARYRAHSEPPAAELAHHFIQAAPGGGVAKAIAYARQAGDAAAAVYAWEEAAAQYESTLALLDDHPAAADTADTRCDLLLALGEVEMPAGEPRRVADTTAEGAFALAETIGDRKRAMRACRIALDALIRYGNRSVSHTPTYRRWAERASRCAESGTSEQVYADIALADVYSAGGEPREVCRLTRGAFNLARTLDDENARFFAACNVLIYVGDPEHWHERLRVAEEALTWPRDGVSARNLGRLLALAADAKLDAGDREQFEELRRQAQQVAARSHDPDVVIYAAIREAEAALLDGRLEDARTAASRLLDQARTLGNLLTAEHAAQRMTLLPLLYLGLVEEAETAHAHTVRLSDLTEDTLVTHSSGSFAATRALILAHGNRDEEAREFIQRTLQRLRIGREEDETPAWILVYLLEAATRAGDHEAVAVLMARLAPIGLVVSSFGTATCVARHLGAAAALLGDRAEARRYYEQALAGAGGVRFRPELALAELGLAELLLDGAGAEAAEAQAHLNLALAELWAMQMQPALNHARRLAARGAGGRRGAATPALPDGLTLREVEVLRLLAAGSSNREIAEALVLSVPTVQNHLAHIYHKIGARSRADATAYALRQGLAARRSPGPTPPDELST